MISVTKFCDEHVMNDHLHGFESKGFQLEKDEGNLVEAVCVHESKIVTSLVEAKENGRRSVKRRRRRWWFVMKG